MTQKKKLYAIGIGGIGVSGLSRYYQSEGWEVSGSDSTDSELIHALISEWCNVSIWSDESRITDDIDLVIHTEAIPETQTQLVKAKKLWIKILKYNHALAEIVNTHKLIAVTGTHGKSTTTSMIGRVFKESWEDFKAIIGTILKEFDGKNYFWRGTKNYFAIEACEHKEHFLAYKPTLGVITNLEYDHPDYFKTPQDYIDAFEKFINNILPGWFCVINGDDVNCQSLIWKRTDIHYILVKQDAYSTIFPWENWESNIETYPEIVMHVPWEHILFDAKIAYIVSQLVGIPEVIALEALEDYSWVWRRMEKIWKTKNNNVLMSDYGHHPTEVLTTLAALKSWYPDKQLCVIFQPHQYSRTIELLEGFKTCFESADILIIPDIYESRDTDENKAAMSTGLLVDNIQHENVHDGNWMENTLKIIEKYDSENPNSSIILLLWAGNIDTLRYKIKTS
jgi:UDP-N-acetylmuramate--alanine ligase